MDYGGSVQGSSPAPGVAAGKDKNKSPQEILNKFWAKFNTKKPGKVTSIFPKSLYASLLPPLHSRGASSARNAAESYEAARAECVAKVKRIVRECERTNTKFTDPDFDIESDLQTTQNCLYGLIRPGSGSNGSVNGSTLKRALNLITSTGVVPGLSDGPVPVNLDALKNVLDPDSSSGGSDETFEPGSVHRVDWIFEKPAFTKDGFSSTDIEQGAVGDCWFMAAVATIAHRAELMDRVCVARDEECGVYGFVFQHDGEWVSTVIDDKLYVSEPDFNSAYGDVYDPTGRKEREYRRRNQRGSKALYFAHCTDSDETWLPLLEKAYAKVHGDYSAISGGYSGEGVEDLTGGVNTVIKTNSVLRKERLWRELENKQGEFVFSLGVGGGDDSHARNGLTTGHAYTVLQAREEKGLDGKTVRLVQIRNPWGERDGRGVGEWKGAWSDGAKEWTPYWLEKLNYKFGDDGLFWMSFSDTLDVFRSIHRTRLFDEKWTVIQQWTSTNVAWVTGYLQSKFVVKVTRAGMVVVVLTQLDDRYFKGLEGQYQFDLHFLLQAQGCEPGEHLCRVRGADRWEQHRSISCEVELEPGTYEVIPKVTATRYGDMPKVEDVVRAYAEDSPQKLRQIGLQYDLAHAKGGVFNEDELLQQAKLERQTKKIEARRKRREKEREAMEEAAKHMEEAAEELHKAAGKGEKRDSETKEAEKKEGDGKKTADAKSGEQKVAEKAIEGSKKATGAADEKNTPQSQHQQQQQQQAKTKPVVGPLSPPEESSEDSEEESSEEEESAEETSDKNGEWEDVPEGEKVETKKDGTGEEEIGEAGPAEAEAGSEAGGEDEGSDDDDDGDEDEDEDDDGEDGDVPPWNAVCVMGLRVYAQDPDVTISLEKPDTMAEATSLTVAEAPAGATM